MKLLIPFILFFQSETLFARSLKATADKLAQETSRIGLGLALFGICIAGIYFILGRQDASTKMTQALLGIFVLMLGPSILSFIKSLA
ncbi:MAG: hypothetical protein JNM93_09175 [Bacteriovoracaceae bacterium]|nr:hypothetical protein [Bacteriovoracaceae bacterium]